MTSEPRSGKAKAQHLPPRFPERGLRRRRTWAASPARVLRSAVGKAGGSGESSGGEMRRDEASRRHAAKRRLSQRLRAEVAPNRRGCAANVTVSSSSRAPRDRWLAQPLAHLLCWVLFAATKTLAGLQSACLLMWFPADRRSNNKH